MRVPVSGPSGAFLKAPAWATSAKSVLDGAFAVMMLLILAVPFMLIAIVICLESPGPVFFRQPRIGLNNQPFWIWKFRTMYQVSTDLGGAQLTSRNDPRVTRVGRWLRKYSIDELPQIINVLIGDMSLVGPRPHPVQAKAGDRLYSEAVPSYELRHVVKPGITGWAQVNGWRGETKTIYQIAQRVAFDWEYISEWSLTLDLRILLLTIPCMWGKNVF